MIQMIPSSKAEIIKQFEPRRIMYAFHDIDGTHSLIRKWVPVMSIVLHNVIENGLQEGYDSQREVNRLINEAGKEKLEETDRFCIESAGLSALTQMEWAIRRGIENGVIKVRADADKNTEIIRKIWEGCEMFDNISEPHEMKELLAEHTPRLFKMYERVLNGACRDKNLAQARKEPEKWRVKGSMEFLKMLKDGGVKNYFVTGAVVEKGYGMYEEVEALGFEVGENKLIEGLCGSTWEKKIPKSMAMKELCSLLDIRSENLLVVGDGRSEMKTGVDMGAITISRLPEEETRMRQLHKDLGVNLIVKDYTSLSFLEMFKPI